VDLFFFYLLAKAELCKSTFTTTLEPRVHCSEHTWAGLLTASSERFTLAAFAG